MMIQSFPKKGPQKQDGQEERRHFQGLKGEQAQHSIPHQGDDSRHNAKPGKHLPELLIIGSGRMQKQRQRGPAYGYTSGN